jgi:UDP-N-acetylmuramoylalanine--D-glutamate ligase
MSGRGVVNLDRLTAAGVREGMLRGRNVTVLGLARSGIAMARFFADAGAAVTVYDRRPAAELGPAIESLGDRSIDLLLGPEVEPAASWSGADLVATSPSINPDYPTAEPRLRAALAELVAAHRADSSGAPALVSETDLVLRMCPCPTIGVTGTKGKTTTSSLAAALLGADPAHPAVLGGNIGIPLVERLPELTPEQRVVIELSELQLPTLSRGTTVAVYTNVTADHLDRHGSLEAYRAVKRRLADLVDPHGALVLNGDDAVVAGYAAGAAAPVVTYRRAAPAEGGLGVDDGWIVAADVRPLATGSEAGTGSAGAVGGRIMPVSELAIPGEHNVSNALAAIGTALLFGLAPEVVRRAAAQFSGVEHRLEPAGLVDGVRFINDSQGTQPDAVIAALRAFPRPLVLIAGGRDKGVDLSGLGPVAAERADAAVLIGESGPALARLLRAGGLDRVELAATLEAAVERADSMARELMAASAPGPATVLLSPAAASFDMFVDYAARGRAFKEAVVALADRRRAQVAER